MSRVLLVTEGGRSAGEFRRPWVRALHTRYAARHRARLAQALARLAAAGDEVAVLTTREFLDRADAPPGAAVHYFDEESYRVDTDQLAALTRELETRCWQLAGAAPVLAQRGVRLPDVLHASRGLVLRMEVAEPLGAVQRVLAEHKPQRVLLLTGASVPERAAALLARLDGLPWARLHRGDGPARAWASVQRALLRRDERLRLAGFVGQPRRAVAPAAARAAGPVLFVTCRPRHHFVVDPLVEALRAAGVASHVIAGPSPDPEVAARLEAVGQAGVPWSYLTDFLSPAECRQLVRARRRGAWRAWRRIEIAAGAGRGGADLVGALLPLAAPFWRDSVTLGLHAAALAVEAAHRALAAIRPRAVVVTSNRRHAERAVALAARQLGIPCLLFSGALVMGRERARLFDVADRLLVIGHELKARLVAEQGVDPARVEVTGDPRSNAARLVPPAELRAAVYRDLGLAPGRPLVILVSKYVSLLFSLDEKARLYRTVFGARALAGDPHVVVKVHPNESLETLRAQSREWAPASASPGVVLTKDYDIHRLFGAADAAVMVTSMAGLEAMAMGCPVVAVQTPGKDFEGGVMPPYVTERAVERVEMDDAAGLAAALGRLRDDAGAREALVERGRRFAARYVHPVDGRLAARLLASIDAVAAERAPR